MQPEYAALAPYLRARDGVCPPRHVVARSTPAAAGEPWPAHEAAVAGARAVGWTLPDFTTESGTAQRSLLDLKIELARRELAACDLCPHHCRVDRTAGEAGYCGVGAESAAHWEGILHAEEAEVVPSHEVFLSGCTMRCAFCYSHEHITAPMSGRRIAPTDLARLAETRAGQGARNLHFVGGEPIVHLLTALAALRELRTPLPVVWNSNMYATPTAMALLEGVVDLFLGDIHFGNDGCARRLGRIPEYLPAVQAAFRTAAESGAGVIIRHLVMPGHVECCARPAMAWAARELPGVPFHLMFQYVPDYRAVGDPVLGRFLSRDEVRSAREAARDTEVLLYAAGPPDEAARAASPLDRDFLGDTVEIVVRPDGRVGFARLLAELVPVAAALEHPGAGAPDPGGAAPCSR